MNIWRTFCVIMVCMNILACTAETAPKAKVTARIVDEKGVPIAGAQVEMQFFLPMAEGMGTDTESVRGTSDADGIFASSGETGWEHVPVNAEKAGYYPSNWGADMQTLNSKTNRWEPWNQTVTLVMKQIRNPVPMFYKEIEWTTVPLFDVPIGYDLERGDWVEPHGHGKVNDFIFTMVCRFENQTDAEAQYTLSFSNPDDGIQEFMPDADEQSSFRWPFSAPSDGYQPTLEKMVYYLPDKGYKTTVKEEMNYIFRVRTVRDSEGRITQAMYGKIRGEIEIARSGAIQFRYWFNPDGSPNLEEDRRQDLFDR